MGKKFTKGMRVRVRGYGNYGDGDLAACIDGSKGTVKMQNRYVIEVRLDDGPDAWFYPSQLVRLTPAGKKPKRHVLYANIYDDGRVGMGFDRPEDAEHIAGQGVVRKAAMFREVA